MALFPIYGVFEGDFVPHLVAIDTDNNMKDVADAVARHSVGRRVARDPKATGYEASIHGQSIDLNRSFGDVMAELNIVPLDFVTVRFA